MTQQITFFYLSCADKNSTLEARAYKFSNGSNLFDNADDLHNKYLCNWLSSSYDLSSGALLAKAQLLLVQLESLEQEERQFLNADFDIMLVQIYREYVQFEMDITHEDVDWPVWRCSYALLKFVLSEWVKFLTMPRYLATRLQIDISDK